MIKTTKQQRQALLKIYRRHNSGESYLAFRRKVQPTIGCNDAVAVPIGGVMWVCVEKDGYAHS
jgi:hypothetical protein